MSIPVELTTNLLQAVRLHYGLSFGQLAGYIGATQQQLWHAAGTGQRELPTTVLLRLSPLANALPPPWGSGPADAMTDAAVPPFTPLALLHPPDPAALRRRLRGCQHLLASLARKLAHTEQRQAQARHLLAVLPALAAAVPPHDARAMHGLQLFEAQAHERLSPAATAALALLLARQQGLQGEAAQLAAWLPELPAGNG
jgi:hypothetical protein